MNLKALCAVVVPVVAVGGYLLWPSNGNQSEGSATPVLPAAALAFKTGAAFADLPESKVCEIKSAVEQGFVKVRFSGNGREKMQATITNCSTFPLHTQIGQGQIFTSGKNEVITVRAASLDLQPGKSGEITLRTIAVSSSNKVAQALYTLSPIKARKFNSLLAYGESHVEFSTGALQTAALALAENLPLSAVAKFSPATEELKSRFNTDAFRVDAIDIISALGALRELGISDSSIAMTIDPQLKIEAMIEPLSRAAAMRYYGITAESEWEFWKTELLSGAPATRHYALYGIARFYPEIALEMLPSWARETRTNSVYRLSALQALADTQRAEALPILRKLTHELGSETELGRVALGAADYLEQRLKVSGARPAAVAFRASPTVSQF